MSVVVASESDNSVPSSPDHFSFLGKERAVATTDPSEVILATLRHALSLLF